MLFIMAEGTYEFEVMRSELLGVEPPDRTVFEAQQQQRMAAQQEEIETELTKVILDTKSGYPGTNNCISPGAGHPGGAT